MHRHWTWLLALSLAILLAPKAGFSAEEASYSGSVEAGIAAQTIDDDRSRVNEYSTQGKDNGGSGYGKLQAAVHNSENALDLQVEAIGSEDQNYRLGIDLKRILKGRFSFDKFFHWTDHDRIGYLDAAIPPPPAAGPNVPLGPNSVPGFFDPASYNPATGTVTVTGSVPTSQQVGRASVYGEDLTPNTQFGISRKEWKNDVSLTIPQLPNLTFHAGFRVETREGMEQAIGMSKCTSCHITGQGKRIDESTEDFTLGVSGKFGLLTMDYSYLDRKFREQAADATRWYDPALSPGGAYAPGNGTFDNRMLYDYEDGRLPFDVTPDSNKDSHTLKAKLDLPHSLSVSGSYVQTSIDSTKADEAAVTNLNTAAVTPIFTLENKTLTTDYDAFGVKVTAKPLQNLILTARARLEEMENDAAHLTFYPMGTTLQPNLGGGTLASSSIAAVRESVIDREVATFGLDALYRPARKTSLRLGYEYQEVDREDEHFGTTDTHTVKASLKTAPVRNLTARLGYTYKNISNPLHNPDAALFVDPLTGLNYTDNQAAAPQIGSGDLYGTAYYDERVADLTNLPENVHELSTAFTLSPQANFAATLGYRIKLEDNQLDHSEWEQLTHSPNLSVWYAFSNKLNLTFAYNYLGRSTESKFCQGWYDG